MCLVPVARGWWSFEAAAGGLMQGMTAQYLTYVGVPVPEGAAVVVHSAGSGVGRMVTQLVARRGGRVIATVSRAHKAGGGPAGRCLAGAGCAMRTGDLGAAIRELAGGSGADIVLRRYREDAVRRERLGAAGRRYLRTYGYAGGEIPPISLLHQPHGVHLVRIRPNGPGTDRPRSGASGRDR